MYEYNNYKDIYNFTLKHPGIFEVRKFSDATKIRYNSGHFQFVPTKYSNFNNKKFKTAAIYFLKANAVSLLTITVSIVEHILSFISLFDNKLILG